MATGGMNVEVKLSGDAVFMKKLEGIMPAMLDFHEALRKTGEHLTNYFSGPVFESMGGDYGTPWKALSPSTVAYKSKHYRQFAAVPLQATGTMRRSFTYSASTVHLEIKNSADYFKYHQSTEPRNKIPRRPMFAINNTVKEIVRLSIEEAFIEKLGAL